MLIRRDEPRLCLDPLAQRLALRVEDDTRAELRQLAHGIGVEALVDAAGQRAGEDHRRCPSRQVAELLEQDLELGPGDLRAPLVDLGVGARGRIDHGRRRPRLLPDPDEVVEDRLLGQLLDDPRARAPAGEAGGDDRHVEPLEGARHVDPLPAGEHERAARAVPVPELEDRDGQRPVERGVESDGDDHGTCPFLAVGEAMRRARRDGGPCGARTTRPSPEPRRPGPKRRRRAVRARSAYRPRTPSPLPTRWPRVTGSARAELTTTRSTSGRSTRTLRTISLGATSSTGGLP